MNDIKRIVLTGGPCGGKTSAISAIVEHFSKKGVHVFSAPEAASILLGGGMDFLTQNKEFFQAGEIALLKLQLLLENSFTAMAETHKGLSLVVCDRGPMDSSTYVDAEMWQRMMAECGIDEPTIFARYDMVIHLTTTAKGAEQFYNTDTNKLRQEKADAEGMRTARMLDDKVLEAWGKHPHHYVIDNSTDFKGKLDRVIQTIEEQLNV